MHEVCNVVLAPNAHLVVLPSSLLQMLCIPVVPCEVFKTCALWNLVQLPEQGREAGPV